MELIINNKYFLICESISQSWNNGVCTLLSIYNGRATIYKEKTSTKFNVSLKQLYPLIKVILLRDITQTLKKGDIVDATIHFFAIDGYNPCYCWYIDKRYPLAFAVSVAEHRDNVINEILND